MADRLKKNNPGCNCCGNACVLCSGATPGTIAVTLTGFANAACTDCSTINTTWVCNVVPAAAYCQWLHGSFSFFCISADVIITISFIATGGGQYAMRVEVRLVKAPTTNIHIFQTATSAATWDCTANRSIPWVSQSGGSLCDSSSATCTIN